MSPELQPTAGNVSFLEQGIRLIRRLDDEQFRKASAGPFRGGVGSQFRHCLDFYGCFLGGLDGGRVDYCDRERDLRIETDREAAENATREVILALSALGAATADTALEVNSELSMGSSRPCWSRSSVRRELQFLLSHTIHHYALISSMLAQQGFRFEGEYAEFGVAPSTLHHWMQNDTLSSS